MLKSPIAAACTSVLVALGASLITPTVSHAATYGGVFDPRTGIYGFDGSHTFDIADACLAGTGWKAVNSDKYAYSDSTTYTKCGEASLTSLTLNVRRYASADPLDLAYNTVVASATYTLGAVPDFGILGIYVLDGELAGVDSDGYFGALGPGPGDLVGPGLYWWLRYASGQSPLGDGFDYGADPVFLASSPCTDVDESCDRTEYPDFAVPTFNRVPEPGSMGLTLAALAAMAGVGLTGGRRQNGLAR